MGIQRALDALTTPKPNDRQALIVFLAQRLSVRGKVKRSPVRIEDVYWLIAVMVRWNGITKSELPSLSRQAVGNLAEDIKDCWQIINQGGV